MDIVCNMYTIRECVMLCHFASLFYIRIMSHRFHKYISVYADDFLFFKLEFVGML